MMSGSHLLLNERPMMVLPSLAKAFGNVNKAIAVQHIHWIVSIKEEHQDDRTLFEGQLWCKLTYAQWGQKLCWLSNSGVRKILSQLEESGILLSCKPEASAGNHAKWYRIDHKALEKTACHKVAIPDVPQSSKRTCHKVANQDVSQSSNSSLYKKDLYRSNKRGASVIEGDFGGDRQDKNFSLSPTTTNVVAGQKETNPTHQPTNQKEKEGSASGGVSVTANRRVNPRIGNSSPDDLESSQAAIAILGDEWESFIKSLVVRSKEWSAYNDCHNDRARALRIKRVYLIGQYERGNLNNICQLYLEQKELESAPQQTQQGARYAEFEHWLEIYREEPFKVKQIAGHRLQEFIAWKNAREELNVAF